VEKAGLDDFLGSKYRGIQHNFVEGPVSLYPLVLKHRWTPKRGVELK